MSNGKIYFGSCSKHEAKQKKVCPKADRHKRTKSTFTASTVKNGNNNCRHNKEQQNDCCQIERLTIAPSHQNIVHRWSKRKGKQSYGNAPQRQTEVGTKVVATENQYDNHRQTSCKKFAQGDIEWWTHNTVGVGFHPKQTPIVVPNSFHSGVWI